MSIQIVHYKGGIGIHGKRWGLNIWPDIELWAFAPCKWFSHFGPFEIIRFNNESWFL